MNQVDLRTGRRRHLRSGAVVATVLAAAGMLAACSSSSGDGGGSGGGGVTSSSQLDAAKAAVDKAKAVPTEMPITEPLTAKPETGKTIVYMKSTDDPTSQTLIDAVTAGADTVGWKVETVGFQLANPATLVAAMQQALTMNPTAVVVAGEPQVVWQSVIPAYEKAKVAIIAGYVGPMDLTDTIVANVAGPAYEEQMATDIANWFIADSEGKGKALLYNVSELPTLKNFGDPFKADVKSSCAGCAVTTLVGSIAQATGGKSVTAIVSELQRDPSIGYVVTDYGAWVGGLRAALNAAGLNKVKIAGSSALPADLAAVKAGTESAFTQQDSQYVGWAMVDAALRFAGGQPIVDGNSAVPYQLAVTGGDFDVDGAATPSDYQDQFKKLWKVG